MNSSFTNLTHVPFLFYGVPKDSLNFVKHRYHSKKMGLDSDYDNKPLTYKTLKELSDEIGQGRNDFMLARFGLKMSTFYSQASKKIKECMYLPEFENRDKIGKIKENVDKINECLGIVEKLTLEGNSSLIGVLDSKPSLLDEMIKSTISNEDLLNQINKESKLYVEYCNPNINKPAPIQPQVPEFDNSVYDKWEEIKPPVNQDSSSKPTPLPEVQDKDENKEWEEIKPPVIEDQEDSIKPSEDEEIDSNFQVDTENTPQDTICPPVAEEPFLLVTPVKAIIKEGEELKINVISRGGVVNYDVVYGMNNLATVSGKENTFIANNKGFSEINYYLLKKETNEIIKATKVLIEIGEKVVEPEVPEGEKLDLILYTKSLEMIIGESANISFKTNSENPIFEVENPEMGEIEKDENGIYVFTALKEGRTRIKISVSNQRETLFDYTVVKIKEKYMEGYPKITGPDELGRKWLQKSQESELVVLYPPYFVEWEKLLEQEKRRIPAHILVKEHQKELDREGKIFDENGVPQYAPSYKYIKDMSCEELDAIPFENLLAQDKALLYADVDGNIVIEGDVYYKTEFKSWKGMCKEEKELTVQKVGFENIYLTHKIELYGNDDKVIEHETDTYYPPEYKGWKKMTEEEKKAIDPSILTQENYDELFSTKTDLRVRPDEVSLRVNGTQEIIVETNATDFTVSSNSEQHASVTKQTGKFTVTAHREGSCIVTVEATAQDASKATVEIPVSIQASAPLPATQLTLDNENVTAKVGAQDAEVNVTTNANTISAESKNPGKATCRVEGKKIKIHPVAEGSGTIEVRATAAGSRETVKTINFTIQPADTQPQPETTLSANPDNLNVKVDSTVDTNITTNANTITAEVEDNRYASVQVTNKRVRVTGVKEGSTKIIVKATVDGGTEKQIQIPVTVQAKEKPATELTLDPAENGTVKVNQELQINVTTNANTISAESKNPGKATVTVEGKIVKVRGVSQGNADIEVRATAEGSKETIKTTRVTVTPAGQ